MQYKKASYCFPKPTTYLLSFRVYKWYDNTYTMIITETCTPNNNVKLRDSRLCSFFYYLN